MSELLEALHRGDDERIAELLADRPRLDVFEAAALGQTDRLRELLDDEPALANAFGDDGFQPLPLACFFGHVDAARLLLQRGADPNTLSRNEHIRTNALHAAAASENKSRETSYELCELLLAHGADPAALDDDGRSALDHANDGGDAATIAAIRAATG